LGAARPQVHRSEIVVPTIEQFHRIEAHAAEHDPEMAVMLRVALMLGGRRSEVVGLRWRDVMDDHVMIRRVVVDDDGVRLEKDPKTHAVRPISIDPATAKQLEQLHARMVERAAFAGTVLVGDAFVFSREADGSLSMKPEWVSDGYRAASKAAGVDAGPLKQLRHLNISLKLAAGVPLEEVSAEAGHSKQSTTLDFYNAFIPTAERKGPAILADLMGTAPVFTPLAPVPPLV
jgi:integrase